MCLVEAFKWKQMELLHSQNQEFSKEIFNKLGLFPWHISIYNE